MYEGNVRDIAFTKSSDGGRTFAPPVRVSDDNWVLDGCPENGPAMIVDDAKRIHIVWPTLVPGATAASEPTMALFYATSQDGRRFTRATADTDARRAPSSPDDPWRPTVSSSSAWDEQARGTRHVAVARGTVDAKGTARFVRQPIGDGTRAEYPVICDRQTTAPSWRGRVDQPDRPASHPAAHELSAVAAVLLPFSVGGNQP